MANPKVRRKLFELNRPEIVYTDHELAALMASSLNSESRHSDFLILGTPGDGLTTFGADLEQKIRSISLTDLDFARLTTDRSSPKVFPPAIRSLIEDRWKNPFNRARANWDSLRTKEKMTCALLYIIALVMVNVAVPAWRALWGQERNLWAEIFQAFDPQNAVLIAGVTILGGLIPAAAIAYWKSLWRSLSDEDLNAQIDELLSLARRNNFRCLIRLFERRFIKSYGPLVLLLDSIDDLGDERDQAFIYQHLLPRLRLSRRVLLVGLSRTPSEERLRFKANASVPRVFTLDTLSVEELTELAGRPVLHVVTVKEALGLRGNYEGRLREVSRQIARFTADYSSEHWNVWTMFCLLASASHLDRRGFTKRSLEDSFKGGIDLINSLVKGTSIEGVTTGRLLDLLNQVFQSEVTHGWFLFDEEEKTYLWNSLARREVTAHSTITWRVLGSALWLFSLLKSFEGLPAGWKAFEMVRLASQLSGYITSAGQEVALNLRSLGTLSTEVMQFFRRTSYADLHRTCGILFFVVRSKSFAKNLTTPEDVMALESCILYGIASREYGKLIGEFGSGANIPSIMDLVGRASARELPVYQDCLERAQTLLSSADAEVKVAARWIYLDCMRQHFILPSLVLRERGDRWEEYARNAPQVSGGFNLATLAALQVVSDAGDLRQQEAFFDVWRSIAEGVTKLVSLKPTNWEILWVEYVALALIAEVLVYSEPLGENFIYDHEGFRHDVTLDFLSDNDFSLFCRLANVVGLNLSGKRLSVLPVASVKGLLETFDGLRLKCLLLSLRQLADSLLLYRAKFIASTLSLGDSSKDSHEGLLLDLERLAASETAINRRILPLEALILLYRLHAQLHKNVSSDIILRLIRKIEEQGCPDELLDALYDRYIQDLRFSHNEEKSRLAVRLLFKRARSKNSSFSHLQISRIYCILASDLLKMCRRMGAELCWKRAQRHFDKVESPISASGQLAEFREVELQIFVEKIRIRGYTKDVERTIIKFLDNTEYRNASGNAFLLLLHLAVGNLSLEHFGFLVAALRSTQRWDWYAGYIWSRILEKLVLRSMSASRGDTSLIFELTRAVVEKLEKSDKNGVDIESAVETLRDVRHMLDSVRDSLGAARASVICEDLLRKKLASRYNEVLKLWAEGGTLGEIAFSYYRLLSPYVEDRLPKAIQEWTSGADDDQFRKHGIESLNIYLGRSESMPWLAIYIAGQLERRALRKADDELHRYLQGVWVQLGINCLESLIETTIASTALPASVRTLLRQQVVGFSDLVKAASADRQTSGPLLSFQKAPPSGP